MKSRRHYIKYVVLVALLMTAFQNCGKFEATIAASSTGNSADNGGSATPGSEVPVTPPVIVPPAASGPTEIQLRQQRCYSYLTNPSFASVAGNVITFSHGQTAQPIEGNVTGTPIAVTANRGVIPGKQAAYDTDSCLSQQTLRFQCALVKDDSTKPVTITHAVSTFGSDRLAELRASIAAAEPAKSAAQVALAAQETIAAGVYNNNNCSAAFAQGISSANITVNPTYSAAADGLRCVEGSFWVKVFIRSELAAINPDHDSEPQFVKVTVNNGCWNEYRLKDANNVNPKIQDLTNLGADVAISGDWVAGVSQNENNEPAATKVGSVYLFKKESTNYVFKQKIRIPDTVSREFIYSIAMSGEYMAIGVPTKGSDAKGTVYLYRRAGDSYSLIGSSFAAADLSSGANFGWSLSMNSSQIAIGASGNNAVYVYQYDGSGIKANTAIKFTGTNRFGTSVSLDGSSLAVGSPGTGAPVGSVTVFNLTNSQILKTFSGTDVGEQFGSKVILRGNRLAVTSAYYYTNVAPQVGRVTFWENYTIPTTPKTFDGQNASAILGNGLALSENGIYIGTPQNTGMAGLVVYYKYSDLANGNYRLRALNESGDSAFGFSIAYDAGHVVIGARTRPDPGDNNGAVYVYDAK